MRITIETDGPKEREMAIRLAAVFGMFPRCVVQVRPERAENLIQEWPVVVTGPAGTEPPLPLPTVAPGEE